MKQILAGALALFFAFGAIAEAQNLRGNAFSSKGRRAFEDCIDALGVNTCTSGSGGAITGSGTLDAFAVWTSTTTLGSGSCTEGGGNFLCTPSLSFGIDTPGNINFLSSGSIRNATGTAGNVFVIEEDATGNDYLAVNAGIDRFLFSPTGDTNDGIVAIQTNKPTTTQNKLTVQADCGDLAGGATCSFLNIIPTPGTDTGSNNNIYGINIGNPNGATGATNTAPFRFSGQAWDNAMEWERGNFSAFHAVPASYGADRTYTWPDASGTITLDGVSFPLTTNTQISDDGVQVEYGSGGGTYISGDGGEVEFAADGDVFFSFGGEWDGESSGYGLSFGGTFGTRQVNLNPVPIGWTLDTTNAVANFNGTLTAMDGDDTTQLVTTNFVNGLHTGTGNAVHAFDAQDIIDSANASEVGFNVDDGYDYSMQWDVLSGAPPDPATKNIGFFIDESVDRGAGTAAADCALILRLSDGTEIAMTPILVTDGVCP